MPCDLKDYDLGAHFSRYRVGDHVVVKFYDAAAIGAIGRKLALIRTLAPIAFVPAVIEEIRLGRASCEHMADLPIDNGAEHIIIGPLSCDCSETTACRYRMRIMLDGRTISGVEEHGFIPTVTTEVLLALRTQAR